MENGTCQLRGRVGNIFRRKTNLKEPQQLSSGDDQDGLSAAQNQEVETPLSAAVLTAATKQGDATSPPPNSVPAQVESTRPSVSTEGSNQASTQPHARTDHKRRVYTVLESCARRCSLISTSYLLTVSEENHTYTVLRLIRKKHSASPYRPPHLNRAEQKNQNSQNLRRLLRVVFSDLLSAISE